MYTLAFWKDTFERIVGTTAAGLVTTFGGANVFELDWKQAAGITGSMAAVTLLKCLAVVNLGNKGTASAVSVDDK